MVRLRRSELIGQFSDHPASRRHQHHETPPAPPPCHLLVVAPAPIGRRREDAGGGRGGAARRPRVRAVSLGGWLVTEGWVKPSLFDGIPNNDLLVRTIPLYIELQS